jgi:hypothetical protein
MVWLLLAFDVALAGRAAGPLDMGSAVYDVVDNGDFEDHVGDEPTGWWRNASSYGVFGWTDVEPLVGDGSAAMRDPSFSLAGAGIALGRPVALTAGDHVLSAFVRNGLGTGNAYLDLGDVAWECHAGGIATLCPTSPVTFTWCGFTVPADQTVDVRLVVDGTVPLGSQAWFDDVAITASDRFVPPTSLDADCDGVLVPDDCDDDDPSVGAAEADVPGSGVDANCDGTYTCFADDDGDGEGGATWVLSDDPGCDAPGESATGTDCDDADADIRTGASEVAGSGVDADCDGRVTCFVDDDGDGAGDPRVTAVAEACVDGLVLSADDCDDGDPDARPGGLEFVGNAVDEDCDGTWDCFVDADLDGFGGIEVVASADADCTDPGEATRFDDCDDADADVNPLAAVVLDDGIDQDCDGRDEATPAETPEVPSAETPADAGPGGGCR